MNFNPFKVKEIGTDKEFYFDCENIVKLSDTTIKISNIHEDFIDEMFSFLKNKCQNFSYMRCENSIYIDFPSLSFFQIKKISVFKEILMY